MAKMTDKQLAKWEKTRNVGQEILQGIRDIKAGRVGRRYTVDSFGIVRARERSRLTQTEFAKLLGVSVRTLQDWEQGRRAPNAAAQTLIKVAEKHPRRMQVRGFLLQQIDDREQFGTVEERIVGRALRLPKPRSPPPCSIRIGSRDKITPLCCWTRLRPPPPLAG